MANLHTPAILDPTLPTMEMQFLVEGVDGAKQAYLVTDPTPLVPEAIARYTAFITEQYFIPNVVEAGYVEADWENLRMEHAMVQDDEGNADPCAFILTLTVRASKRKAEISTISTLLQ